MLIIGIDPGIVNIGIALIRVTEKNREIVLTKTLRPTKIVPDNLEETYNYFQSLCSTYPIDYCSYEKPWQNNKSPTGEYLYYLLGVIKLVMQLNKIKMSCYPPTTLKKEFLGNGRGKKEDIKQRVIELYGTAGSSNHVDDAIALVEVFIKKHKELNDN